MSERVFLAVFAVLLVAWIRYATRRPKQPSGRQWWQRDRY